MCCGHHNKIGTFEHERIINNQFFINTLLNY